MWCVLKKSVLALTLVIVLAVVGAVFYAIDGFLGSRQPSNNTSKEPQITNTSTYTNSTTGLTYVYGEVQNTLNAHIRHVNVNGTFYNSVDKAIGVYAFGAFPTIMKPTQKGSFALIVSGPERDTFDRYELSVNYEPTEDTPLEGLMVLSTSSFITESGYYKIVGEVKNNGREKVVGVILYCTFYDSAGKVIGIDFGYTDPRYIYSSQIAPFEMEWEMQRTPARYELQVEGKLP